MPDATISIAAHSPLSRTRWIGGWGYGAPRLWLKTGAIGGSTPSPYKAKSAPSPNWGFRSKWKSSGSSSKASPTPSSNWSLSNADPKWSRYPSSPTRASKYKRWGLSGYRKLRIEYCDRQWTRASARWSWSPKITRRSALQRRWSPSRNSEPARDAARKSCSKCSRRKSASLGSRKATIRQKSIRCSVLNSGWKGFSN